MSKISYHKTRGFHSTAESEAVLQRLKKQYPDLSLSEIVRKALTAFYESKKNS